MARLFSCLQVNESGLAKKKKLCACLTLSSASSHEVLKYKKYIKEESNIIIYLHIVYVLFTINITFTFVSFILLCLMPMFHVSVSCYCSFLFCIFQPSWNFKSMWVKSQKN